MKTAKSHYIVIAIVCSLITIMYWVAAMPPRSPWIFAITGAGALFSIGVTIYKKRKGTLT